MWHEEWFAEAINNLKDTPFKIDSNEMFKNKINLLLGKHLLQLSYIASNSGLSTLK